MMKKILFLLLFTCSAYAQEVALVHINAEFNESNNWYGLDIVENCKVYNGYIESNSAMQEKYKVTRVPTLILYRDGKEEMRWEAGLDMKLHVNVSEVQRTIDK